MKNNEELVKDLLERLKKLNYIHSRDIPDIELYMDQVTTFMDQHLSHGKRRDEDKILTKTMINNYAKNNLLPPPVKKKYSREHILVMIFIYYFKNILSIKDIETMLNPITEKYFDNGKDFNMTSIYEEICRLEKSRIDALQKDVAKSYHHAMSRFPDAPSEERDYLQFFAFICSLSFDVYIKKQIIEKLLDQLPEEKQGKKKK